MGVVQDLGLWQEAIAFADDRLRRLVPQIAVIDQAMDLLASKAGELDDAARHQTLRAIEKAGKDAAVEYEQNQRAIERQLRQVVALVGPYTDPAVALKGMEIQRRTADIARAEEMGILSSHESAEILSAMTREYQALQDVAKGFSAGGQAGAELVQAVQKAPSAAKNFLQDQVGGIATGVTGLLATLPISGGLFGLMMHGNSEQDRLKAQAGEVTNLFVAGGGEVKNKVVAHVAAFGEKAQALYGIARSDVNAIVHQVIDAGLTADQILEVHRKDLGEAGHDAMTMTLALDRHFEMANGTSMRLALGQVREEGATLEGSIESVSRMAFAAHRAGIGISEFTSIATQTARELHTYGVHGEAVAVVMLSMQSGFQRLGISSQAAFGWSKVSMGEISQGLNGLSPGMKVHLAEQLGLGEGYDASYKMQDTLMNGGPDQLAPMLQGLAEIAKTETTGMGGGFGHSENAQTLRERYYLEKQGFGFEGAEAILMLVGKVGLDGKLKDVSKEEWAHVKDAFKTEGQKVSENEKNIYTISQGLAKIGQGMLVLFSNFAAVSILSIKALLSLDYTVAGSSIIATKLLGAGAGEAVRQAGGALLPGGNAETLASLRKEFAKRWEGAAEGGAQILSGAEQSKEGLAAIAGPILSPIIKALRFQGSGFGAGEIDSTPERVLSDAERAQDALFNAESEGTLTQTTSRAGAPLVVQKALAKVGTHAGSDEATEMSFGRREWWCMDFVGWANEQAGFTDWGSFARSMHTETGKGIEAWARKTGHWHDALGYVPKPGDTFFIERYSGEVGDGFIGEHVGMVVDILEDGTLLTVEGNAAQHGVTGVWQHKRDPSRSVFKGFISTRMSGTSHASQAARTEYLKRVEKTQERKKNTRARLKAKAMAEAAHLVSDREQRALAQGRTNLTAEDLTSHAEEGGMSVAPTVTATKVHDQTGVGVEVQIDFGAIDFSKSTLGARPGSP